MYAACKAGAFSKASYIFGFTLWDWIHSCRASFSRVHEERLMIARMQAIAESFVPVIKLEINGIDVDLTYAQLSSADVPSEAHFDLQGRSVLRGMSEASVRSINGCRVTDKLVQLRLNEDAFRNALRYLKV